jgi:hypothetical protein
VLPHRVKDEVVSWKGLDLDLEHAKDVGWVPADLKSFTPGHVIVQREVVETYVCSAVPVRIGQDTHDLIPLYRAPGKACAWPSHP